MTTSLKSSPNLQAVLAQTKEAGEEEEETKTRSEEREKNIVAEQHNAHCNEKKGETRVIKTRKFTGKWKRSTEIRREEATRARPIKEDKLFIWYSKQARRTRSRRGNQWKKKNWKKHLLAADTAGTAVNSEHQRSLVKCCLVNRNIRAPSGGSYAQTELWSLRRRVSAANSNSATARETQHRISLAATSAAPSQKTLVMKRLSGSAGTMGTMGHSVIRRASTEWIIGLCRTDAGWKRLRHVLSSNQRYK